MFKVSSGSDLLNLELRTENIPFQMHLSLVSFAGLDYYGIDCLLLFELVCRLLVCSRFYCLIKFSLSFACLHVNDQMICCLLFCHESRFCIKKLKNDYLFMS